MIVLAPGARADAPELDRHARTLLAGYKVPRSFEFAASLPRTTSGELKRSLVRGE